MVKPVCLFIVCQILTLQVVGFSWTKKQKQPNLKFKSSAQHAKKRHLKNNSFGAEKSTKM